MEVVKLKKKTSYLVPGAISDVFCLKVECLDVWNKAAIAAYTAWVVRDKVST